LNLGQLAKAVADRFQLPEAEARKIIAFSLQEITGSLKAGRRAYLRSFCSFTKVIRQGKKVRHPRTGQIIWIPPRPDVEFRASPALLRSPADHKRSRAPRSKRRDKIRVPFQRRVEGHFLALRLGRLLTLSN